MSADDMDDDDRRHRNRAHVKRYAQSLKGKEARARYKAKYRATERGKAKAAEYQRRYYAKTHGKEVRRRRRLLALSKNTGLPKLTDEQVIWARSMYPRRSFAWIARALKVARCTAKACVIGKTYRHVPMKEAA